MRIHRTVLSVIALETSGAARGVGPLLILLSAVALATSQASAQTLTTIYTFTGGDGANPHAGLIADAAGNLYGTTVYGGANGNGTVFKVTPTGSETVLYSFTGGSDGANPEAGLIADASGNLYGTTANGGSNGVGTVFKLAIPAQFKGVPGQPNCYGQSISFMAKKYGGLAHAATSLGYSSISALQSGVTAYCGGM